jgi:uncharacterized protein YuzE
MTYKIKYNPLSINNQNFMYIKIEDKKIADSECLDDNIIIDKDEDGNIIGIQVLDFIGVEADLNAHG